MYWGAKKLSIKQDTDVACMVDEDRPAIMCIIRAQWWWMGATQFPVKDICFILISFLILFQVDLNVGIEMQDQASFYLI